jgi:hypothetical protein
MKSIPRPFLAALVVVALGLLAGATVFREQIARAAQGVSAEITSPLDQQGNVKVHEQGTASVSVRNPSLSVQQAGEPVTLRLGIAGANAYTVPAGKRLLITFVNALVTHGGGLLLSVGPHTYVFGLDANRDVVSDAVTIFAGSGASVSATGDLNADGLVSGYLLDA